MNIKKNSYLQNFIVTCAGVIGFAIVFFAFDLNIFQSFHDTLIWLGTIIVFLIYIIILRLIFPWINPEDIIDGIWIGIVLFCWSPIITLFLQENFINALKGASTCFVIGTLLLFLGYKCSKRK